MEKKTAEGFPFLCNQSNLSVQLAIVRPAGCPSCMAKTLTLDMLCKLLKQSVSYLPCLWISLTSLIFVPFSVTLTMAGDHKISSEQSMQALFSLTFFCLFVF